MRQSILLQEATEETESFVVTSLGACLTPNRFSALFSPFAPVHTHTYQPPLFWLTQPGILPRNRDVLVIAAKPDKSAPTVAHFQRLTLGDRDRDSASDTRVSLLGERVLYAVDAGFPAEPEIAVERGPEERFEVVAQMPFNGPNGTLLLRTRARKKGAIPGIEPHSCVP